MKSVAIALASTAVLVASACVGDDPAVTTGTAKPDGERGGKCFPNNTCNGAALSCIDGVCILPGDVGAEGGTGGNGEGGTDGSALSDGATSDAGSDGAIGDCSIPPGRHPANELPCNGAAPNDQCAPGRVCCTSTGVCQQANCGAAPTFACQGTVDCQAVDPNQVICCLTQSSGAFKVVAGQCQSKVTQFASTKCVATANNCTGGLVTCTKEDSCSPNHTCTSVDVQVGDVAMGNVKTFTLGVCIPKPAR